MRVAHVSDLHTNLPGRQEECWRVLDWLVRDLRARAVDLVVLPGDLVEHAPNAEEEDRLARFLLALAETSPVVGCLGNHDLGMRPIPRLRLPCSDVAGPRHPIVIVDRPQVVRAGGAAIACLPWPRPGNLLQVLGDADKDARHHAGVTALRTVLLGLRQELEQHDGPRLLIAHAHVRGARLGQHIPERVDFQAGVEDLAGTGADYVALAHLHEHQHWTWRVDGSEVVIAYAGSPFANTWGEVEKKGYIVADFDDARDGQASTLRSWGFVPTNATPLLHTTAAFSGEALHVEATTGPVAGTAIRLRYEVTGDQREAGERAAQRERDRLLDAGAADVVLEPVIQTNVRARLPEITAATDIPAQVAVWARAQPGVDEARAERLRGMAASLERVEVGQ